MFYSKSLALLICLYCSPGVALAAGSFSSLVETLSEENDLPREEARAQISQVFSAIANELESGRSVTIRRFGKFYLKESRSKRSRGSNGNAKIVPDFTPSPVLRRQIDDAQTLR